MFNQPAHLRVPEWIAVVCFISVLATLTLITLTTETGTLPMTRDPPHYIVDPRIEVFVEGAVEKKGRLIVTRGMRVKEVLEQAKPLPEADLSKVKLESKVRRGQRIRVPVKKFSAPQ